jgi:hypothetical protein
MRMSSHVSSSSGQATMPPAVISGREPGSAEAGRSAIKRRFVSTSQPSAKRSSPSRSWRAAATIASPGARPNAVGSGRDGLAGGVLADAAEGGMVTGEGDAGAGPQETVRE